MCIIQSCVRVYSLRTCKQVEEAKVEIAKFYAHPGETQYTSFDGDHHTEATSSTTTNSASTEEHTRTNRTNSNSDTLLMS